MLEKGRKKRSCFIILVVVLCLIVILGFIFFTPKSSNEPTRKSFETAKLYLEYSANVSLTSKNVFEYKEPSESGMKNLTIELTSNSISSPTSGKIDFAIKTEKDKENTFAMNYIISSDGNLFLKFEHAKNIIESLDYVDFLKSILSKEATEAIKESNEDWILINNEDISFILEMLLLDVENPEEDLTCFDDFLDKYDQTTTRFITSTIDDEIEKYVFYTSDDKIEKMANDMKKCFSSKKSNFLIDKIVGIVESFSGLTAELDENSKLMSLSVNNELEEYYFESTTTFDYNSKYFYPESPESYLTFDDLFKVDN